MDSKRVIELAREADACHDNVQVTPFLERFAALIEREVRGDAEPVAWMYTLEYGDTVADKKVSLGQLNYPFGVCGADCLRENSDGMSYVRQTPLYAHPAPTRQPLTDEQIDALQLPESGKGTIRDLVRIIEAAHGIGGSDD